MEQVELLSPPPLPCRHTPSQRHTTRDTQSVQLNFGLAFDIQGIAYAGVEKSYILKSEASVRLCPLRSQRALTLYPATDCAAATDISAVSGRWQLSR